MAVTSKLRWLYLELGLDSLFNTGLDAWLIITARCCRMIAFGTNSLILALFFAALKFSDFYIGLFMTLTLAGDVLLSLVLTVIADRVGRRKILIGGSVMMILSGMVFALFDNYWILLLAAVFGVISATGGDFGPFRAIEESILSTLTDQKTRPDVLSWYVTTATLGQSIGTEFCGRIVNYLEKKDGWTLADSYHAIFWIYSAMGTANLIFMFSLSDKCEAPPRNEQLNNEEEREQAEGLLGDEDGDVTEMTDRSTSIDTSHSKLASTKPKNMFSQFLTISPDTRSAVFKLWILLIFDSLADGMVPYSLTNYYMDIKFSLPKSTLGDITSASYFLGFISTLFAAPLSRRLGLVNTMVFTHLPSSIAVLVFPFPSSIVLTVICLLIRTGLNNMDQAPRAALIAAIVRPEERTAIMGITAMMRTLASVAGPTLTGLLAGRDKFWIAFVTAGLLRIGYDLGLWAMFVNMKLYLHEEKKVVKEDERRLSDEESVAATSRG